MSKVKGTLEKAYKNKHGYWSINVNNEWYGTFETDYTDKEGCTVEFESAKKGNFLNVKGDVKVVGAAKQVKSSGGNISADARQSSIVLQSSTRTAADIVIGALQADAVALPSAKAKKFDTILGLIDEVTERIYNNCINPESFLNGGEEDPEARPSGDFNPIEA
jgi:hypothetical protein